MRFMTTIILLLAIVPIWGGEADELPREAQRAEEERDEALERAQAAYDEAVAEADEDYERDMDRAIQRATRAGDLEAALAIRERKEAVLEVSDGDGGPVDILGSNAQNAGTQDPAAEWDALRGQVVTVSAVNGAQVNIPGQSGWVVRLVPHPEDRWANNPQAPGVGIEGSSANWNGHPVMALLARQGLGDPVLVDGHSFTAEEQGSYQLYPNDNGTADNIGEIRVKMVAERAE